MYSKCSTNRGKASYSYTSGEVITLLISTSYKTLCCCHCYI